MKASWPHNRDVFTFTVAELFIATLIALIGAVLAERLGKNVRAVPVGLLVGALLGLLVAQAAVKVATPAAGGQPPVGQGTTAGTPPASPTGGPTTSRTATTSTTKSTPKSTPKSTTKSQAAPVRTASAPARAAAAPGGTPTTTWLIDASTSDASDATPVTGKVIRRFWHYPGTFGDVAKRGSYATAAETVGRDCGNPYVRYILDGVPSGTYSVSVYIPDLGNLSDEVEVGTRVVNQAAARGQWVHVGDLQAKQSVPSSYGFDLATNQTFHPDNPSGCKQTGRQVAFGPAKFTRKG